MSFKTLLARTPRLIIIFLAGLFIVFLSIYAIKGFLLMICAALILQVLVGLVLFGYIPCVVYGITELQNEPDNWVNQCAAKYYGVRSISAVEDYAGISAHPIGK
jgi:hypothetical protein